MRVRHPRHDSSARPGGADADKARRVASPLHPGQYLASAHELFQVKACGETRAVVENCLSGDLFDVAVEELLGLRHVEAAVL